MGTTYYEDADTGELFTFESLKESMEKAYGKKISDKELETFIFQNLAQNGGNIIVREAGEHE